MRPTFRLLARVYKSFMANKKVSPRKGFGADVASKWFLFRVCADVALQMLKPCEETLAMWARECLGLCGGRSLAPFG